MKSLVLIVCCLLTFNAYSQPSEEQIRQVEEAKRMVRKMKGKPFPEFKLTTMDGTTYTNEDVEGKVLVMNFWFSSCKPCIGEIPEMNEMVDDLKNEEVVFLAPTFDSPERVDRFLNKWDFEYQIVPDVKDFCLELNVRSYPTHLVVNREGIIEKVIIGFYPRTMGSLRKSVSKLLKSE